MTQEYVKVKDVAKIKGISVRAVQKAIKNGKYEYRIVNGNGGKQYEILFSSLEPDLQAKLKPVNNVVSLPVKLAFSCEFSKSEATVPVLLKNSVTEEQMELLKTFGLDKVQTDNRVIPEQAKKKALYKVDLILKWLDFRQTMPKMQADKKFEELYNSKLYAEKLYSHLGKVSIKSIYRWYKDWESANRDFEVLVDGYSYGSDNQLRSSLSDLEKFYLLKFMLHQNKYKLADAYELIKINLQKIGVENIASESAYRRVWNYVCNNYSDMVVYAREGLKAALDTKLPYIKRNKECLNVGDIIVGDGHVLDFNVINPIDGKPVRATLVGFLDWASWDLIGFDIMTTENTQSIASALRNSIINLGKMPKVVYIDNGKAFKNKTFNGFSEDGIQGIYEKLGIQVMFSRPYNGRAKVVERFWEELTNSFAKLMPSYIGNNIENKPAYTKRNEKEHAKMHGDFIPTIEETKTLLEMWLNEVYRKRKCLADKRFTIAEYFKINKGKGINIDKLDDLMMTSEKRKIGRNGIRLFNDYYYAPELTGLNKNVIAKYNMFDLSYIKVYSLKNEFICKATRTIAVNPAAELLGSPKDLHEYRQQQKAINKIQKNRIKSTKKALSTLYSQKIKTLPAHVIPQAKELEEPEMQITCYEDDLTDGGTKILINY